MALDVLWPVWPVALAGVSSSRQASPQVWGNESHLRLNLRQPIFLQHGAHGSNASPRRLALARVKMFHSSFPFPSSADCSSQSLPHRTSPVEKKLGRSPCPPLSPSLTGNDHALTTARLVWTARVQHAGNPPRYISRFPGWSQTFPDAASREPLVPHSTCTASFICSGEGR